MSSREVVSKGTIDTLFIDETKLGKRFPDFQFQIENYQFPPFCRNRNPKGGIVYVRQGLITKILWCILFAYRSPCFNKRPFLSTNMKIVL